MGKDKKVEKVGNPIAELKERVTKLEKKVKALEKKKK